MTGRIPTGYPDNYQSPNYPTSKSDNSQSPNYPTAKSDNSQTPTSNFHAERGIDRAQRADGYLRRSRISRVLFFSRNESETMSPSNILMMSRLRRTCLAPPEPA